MRDLTEIRQRIDQIDQKMLALFKERMGCSAEVAEYKRGTGKAIYDRTMSIRSSRESVVIVHHKEQD